MTDEKTIDREYPSRVPATALFNRINGELISVTSVPVEDSQHNPEYYIARGIMYSFGEDGDKIEGNIIIEPDGTFTDNFRVLAPDEQTPTVYEAQLNAMAAEKITSKYPLTKQLNLVVACVNRLGGEHNLLETDEFKDLNEMIEYINYCVQVNQTKKEYYANDPTVKYYSDKDLADLQSRQMEGGVHEEIGSRIINGGRVWS